MQLGALLKELGTRAGLDLAKPELAAALALTNDIPDAEANLITSNLFNESAAKSHKGLSDHFKATHLNGVDSQIELIATENNLSADAIAEIKAEKSTAKRTALLNKKVKEALTEQFGKDGDKGKLVAEIAKLNADIVGVRNQAAADIKKAQDIAELSVTDYAINSSLATMPWANADLPADVNILTARALLNKSFAEKGAQLVRKDGVLKLVKADAPELDYTENNQPVKFQDFTNKVLATNKLLKVNDPAKKQEPTQKRQAPTENAKQVIDSTAAANNLRETAKALRAANALS